MEKGSGYLDELSLLPGRQNQAPGEKGQAGGFRPGRTDRQFPLESPLLTGLQTRFLFN